jgi:nicotinamidase/pyrazinamidase
MRALILIDIQDDFLPGGALAVPRGDEVIAVANRLSARADFDVVVATRDLHPAGHGSFASSHPGRRLGEVIDLDGLPQVMWPDHCVEGTPGSELAAALDRSRVARVFVKGTDPAIDSYSGFHDNGHRKATGLGDWLKARGVDEVWVLGLATDYCVRVSTPGPSAFAPCSSRTAAAAWSSSPAAPPAPSRRCAPPACASPAAPSWASSIPFR